MDFGSLLQTAKENGQAKKEVRYYSTKFAPPKKEEKKAKNLSVNIQKFLARKEAEEKQKTLEAIRKRDELLALRSKDKKATRRVNVMLKRTKSANQSVIEDAVDKDNTAVTLAGPSQPDEDDYGYVSQEASAFYNKMMEKYNKIPDDPKFSASRKKASNNLISTKDRVKAALEREREEALLPHRRKRKHKDESEVQSECLEKLDENEESEEPVTVKKKPKPMPPPSLNFNDLLKLAAVKQHEPIMIEVKPKDDEGPLLTKKQKKELEREEQRKEAKRILQQSNNKIPAKPTAPPPPPQTTQNKKIPPRNPPQTTPKQNVKVQPPNQTAPKPKIPAPPRPPIQQPAKVPPKPTFKPEILKKRLETNDRQIVTKPPPPVAKSASQPKPISKSVDVARKGLVQNNNNNNREKMAGVKPRPVENVPMKKPAPPPSQQLKPKQFPPPDVRRREPPPKPKPAKRPIIYDDDEDYDSEMDDFIDDGPEEMQDYSSYIKDIFGYDKSKYRGMDEDINDMESTFAQQMREDVRSTKLGIMEDLEDIKREREEKKRKQMMKKRKL